MITGTVNAWCTSLGLDRQAFETRLARAGAVIAPKCKLTARQVFVALAGDKEVAQARKALAEAEEKERENRLAERELMVVADVERIVWEQCLLPLKQSIDALPATLASQCNPDNPQLALGVLENWKEQVKKQIKEKL